MAKELRVSTTSVVVSAAAVAAVALMGGYFTGMNRGWYDQLIKPAWQPPDWAFPIAWTTIFILVIVSIVLVWNTRPRTGLAYWTIGFFILNGILNVTWSALFFGNRLILPAVYDAGLLFLSVLTIMILAWPISRAASLLLIPYACWVAFAAVLTWTIYRLNG